MSIASLQSTTSVELEWVACEICGKDERSSPVRRKDLFLGGDTLYSMYTCEGCGAVYQYPRPTATTIGKHYPPDYVPYTKGIKAESWIMRLQRRYGLAKRCRLIVRHVPKGRLLDVGCATGDFLSEMRRQTNWSVVGVEPSHTAAEYAAHRVGITVIESVLNQAPFANASFDAITMWDVLEHVYDPQQVIAEAARLLRPGGILVINHPNLKSIDRKLFKKFWCGYELPRHLYLFPNRLLQHLMEVYGMEEVERRCIYGSHAATMTSLTFIAQAIIGKGNISSIIQRMLLSKVLRILLLPYFKCIDSLGLGSNITVVFKKIR